MSKEQFLKENQRKGEIYAGLLLGKDGQPDQHIFLLPGKKDEINWEGAKKWATSVGGDLPTCREQSLLIANLKEEFEPRAYWSSEPNGDGWAWCQIFTSGRQGHYPTSRALRARAVRRLPI